MTDVPRPLAPPARLLMGPGPSEVPSSVLRAMAAPTIGHLDPYFLRVMDAVRDMLAHTFGASGGLTVPISGTGSAGMETCLVNLIEPGDRVLVGKNGAFGARMAEVAARAGAQVTAVEGEWGRALGRARFEAAAGGRSYKLLCVVHAETSTGVLEDLAPIKAVADAIGALFVVDAVTSLGGVEVGVDALGIDAVYSGTQKCLSCPPGLSPVSLSPRALEVLSARTHPVQSWYLDLSLIGRYWGADRVYHHTAPINMLYALHEALRLVAEEGLEARFARHRATARALTAGLEAMGLELLVPAAERLPPLTTVRVPHGVDEARVRRAMLDRYSVEIGGGLGPLKGAVWRIGLMGASCTLRHVTLCLAALRSALAEQGFEAKADPIRAAEDAG